MRTFSMSLVAALLLLTSPAMADRATPFVEIDNEVGDISQAWGYVVALDTDVDRCPLFLVIVSTDTMQFLAIHARAEAGVVTEEMVGRQVRIRAEVLENIEISDDGDIVGQLAILEVTDE